MFNLINFKKLTTASMLAVLMAATFAENGKTEPTGTLDFTSYEVDMDLTQTTTLDRTVTVNIDEVVETITTTVPASKLDVLFLADNTGSMGSAIQNVQENARSLLQTLSETYSDLQVGVARYYGDPSEYGWCSRWSWSWSRRRWICLKTTNPATRAYELQESVDGGSIDDAIAAINGWRASGGGDWPEANFFALHQAATSGAPVNEAGDYATGYNTGWRSDAKKLIVWFGDARSQTNTVTQDQAIQALNNNDITVVAIHTTTTTTSFTQGLDYNLQASSIASQTSGNYASVYSSEVASTMLNLIGTAATITTTETVYPTIDLAFVSEGDTSGLDVTYTCIDPQGCNDVSHGDSRLFRMTITGNAMGIYDFDTVVVDADFTPINGAVADNLVDVVAAD